MAAVSPLNALSARARSIWAKSGDGEQWLALAQHMIDAAGVAELLWENWLSARLRRELAELCRLSPQDTGKLFKWLACVHDIGKASLQFTTQLSNRAGFESLTLRMHDAGLGTGLTAFDASVRISHGAASYWLVRNWLRTTRGYSRTAAGTIASVVDAHHGLPSFADVRAHADAVFPRYSTAWQETWRELLDFAADYCAAGAALATLQPHRRTAIPVAAQTLLTGLVIMADWIASNQEAFPCSVTGLCTTGNQRERVRAGYARVRLTPAWQARDLSDINDLMRARFALPEDATARPVQRVVAEACHELTSPALLIVEAPTGEGKTEAALMGAEILAARNHCAGVFFGAPTMSTSDALFTRVLDWAARAVPEQQIASVFLGHSKAALNEEYQQLRHGLRDIGADTAEHGEVIASEWLSGRKKGLLANFTVGTVDQLLMMALQSRHIMLRHLAFADKVVIVDEVHAYDAYMNQYLQRALEWLATYGVSVIMLSATLPRDAKKGLLNAYARGLDATVPHELSSGYPLVTVVSSGGVQEIAVPARPADLRASLTFIGDEVTELCELLERETAEGGCVLVLCNSVLRAQAVLRALPAELQADARLLHARFTASDRLARERELVRELGPDAHPGSGRPVRRIIVATQVAEQSLDIDVDLLITDIAPMDLVLQRLGRLHRHRRPPSDRPGRLREPRILVRGVLRHDAIPAFEPHTKGIYGERLLLSTYLLLRDARELTRPDDVPALVQAAYDDSLTVPANWQEHWQIALTEFHSQRNEAEHKAHEFRIPLSDDARTILELFKQQTADVAANAKAEERGYAQVRDTDPSIEVVLIVARGTDSYRPLPWLVQSDETYFLAEPSYPTALALAHSTVRLPGWFGRYRFDAALTELEQQTPTGWQHSPLLRGLVALRLDESLCAELVGKRLRYDRELGLVEEGR